MSRRWDAASYDRVADALTRWGTEVQARLPLAGDEVVLDAGCGTGRVTEQLAERLPNGRVIALDVSAAMLEAARVRLARFGDRVSYLQADLGVPLALPTRVDAVVSTAALHWVLDQDALYANLGGAVRPGGRLSAQCGGAGNCASVFRAMERLGADPLARLHFASPHEARRRLITAGFAEVDAWTHSEPITFAERKDFERYLATVFLGPLIDLPVEDLPRLAREIATELPGLTIDYVRLDLLATRAH